MVCIHTFSSTLAHPVTFSFIAWNESMITSTREAPYYGTEEQVANIWQKNEKLICMAID